MRPRARKIRRVLNPPSIKGFIPLDMDSKKINTPQEIVLHFEEYEALRLCDYEMHTHEQAAMVMGVSRPTFTRIYSSVRRKIARAFVDGLPITIEGGKVYFDSNWYKCQSCRSTFNNPNMEEEITQCPLCGSKEIAEFEMKEHGVYQPHGRRHNQICKCIECGYEMEHTHGKPCHALSCPQCQNRMRRK